MPIETDAQLLDRITEKLLDGETYFVPSGENSALFAEGEDDGDDPERSGHSPSDDPETHPKYDNTKYKRKPHNIWFYYKRMNTDGTLLVREYIVYEDQPISNGQMKTKVKKLALNARKSLSQQNPKPTGNNNFTNIEIKRVCYFVIFVDEQNWEFQRDNGKPVVLFKKTDPKGDPCRPNFSFFKADAFKTDMGGGDIRESLVMVNYLKRNAAGDELISAPPEDQNHRWFFDYPQRVLFLLPDRTDDEGNAIGVSAESPRLTIMIDPGGNNLGPPDPP